MKLSNTSKFISGITFISIALLSACGATNPTANVIEQESQIKEPEIITIEENDSTTEETAIAQENPIVTIAEEKTMTAAQLYAQMAKNVVLTVTSVPKETRKAKAFSSSYTVKVTDKEGDPLSNFKITAVVPVTKDKDNLSVNQSYDIFTDENGIATYTPEVPTLSFDEQIIFFPAVEDNADSDVLDECFKVSVSAPYKVYTDYVGRSGIIYIIDMNKTNTAFDEGLPSSSLVQKALRNYGFTGIGNGPDFSQQILNGTKDSVYKEAKRMLGNNFSFLIYGTMKYDAPVVTDERGKTVSLTADVTCINMVTGNVLLNIKESASASAASESQALSKVRNELTSKIGTKIYYGM